MLDDENRIELTLTGSFGKYGKQFQEGIFHGLLTDHPWAAQMMEVMRPEFFDVKYLEFLCQKYFQYFNKYKCFPSMGLLVPIIKEDLSESPDSIMLDQIVDYLHRLKTSPNMGDLQYIKDKSLDFCKRQAFKEALEKAVELISTDKFESVVGLMKDAVAVGLPSSVGHDFFQDAEARFVRSRRQCCPTGLERLDAKDILQGGLGRGEIGVITANTGVGKCAIGDTLIKVKYTEVLINGKAHKPWQRVDTKRGLVFARDITEQDDSVTSIQFQDRVDETEIGQLFFELGYDDLEPTERPSEWAIEVLSFDGFYPIEGFRTVEPQGTFLLVTECGKRLEGADDHIVLEHSGWTKMKDLRPGDRLISHDHSPVISRIEHRPEKKKLYDLQVATAHSFMTNGILSHNSHFLVALGANAMRVGKNVVHYTFELTETAVGIRYDSNLCDVPSNEVPDSKELIMKKYEKMELGRLIIKEYPTGSASVHTIRNHLEKVMMKGFIPSLVVIDYADVMRSTRQFDSLRHELKLIYEELRNLSMDMNIPIWTASQSNRSGSTADVVGLENMSEAYGKAMVADVVLSLSRKPMEKDKGTGRIFVAKNRAGRDGVLFPVHIDTARSRFSILDPTEMSLTEAITQDESAMKGLLKQKWREVSGN